MQLRISLSGRFCSCIRTKFKNRLVTFAAVLILLIISMIIIPFLKTEANWFHSFFRTGIYTRIEFDPKVQVFKIENTTKPLKIVIWISPKTDDPKFRKNLVKTMIAVPQNKNACYLQKYKCEMTLATANQTKLMEADAILFFMFNRNYKWNNLPPSWQKWRKQDQIWIISADEAPINILNVENSPAVFNWSISYRRDSTIWLPYGRVVPLSSPSLNQDYYNKITKAEIKINNVTLSEWIKGKTRLIVGVISHCYTNSYREILVNQMKESINSSLIDIFGACGTLKIGCSFYTQNCSHSWANLAKKYKFYLAFENALCVDYITEKFWRTLEIGMVPVVYGGANYTQLAPRNSFIDVQDFKSAEDLMEHLERVGSNATEYAKYFEWRRHFKLVKVGDRYMSGNDQAWCELCEKLRIFKTKTGVIGGGNMSQLPGNWWIQMPNNVDKPCKLYADREIRPSNNLSTIKYLPSLTKLAY